MRNAKARLHQSAKAITSILMGVILLLGGVSAPAVAQGTEYYVADGWVLLDPTATPLPTATPAPTGAESAAPAETPAQSVSPSPEPTPVPEGTLTAVADGIAFSVLPAADSPLQGASFAVQPLTDAAALAAAQAAYGARYAADGAAAQAPLALYQLRFTKDGSAVPAPSGLVVRMTAALGGFVPVRAMSVLLHGETAALSGEAPVMADQQAWYADVTLTDGDALLLGGRPEAQPTDTPPETPTLTPEASPENTPETSPEVTPEVSPEVSPEATPEVSPEPSQNLGTYVYEDEQISLSASVTGALPPEGAWLSVTPANLAPANVPEGLAAAALLSYRVGFRSDLGELGTADPLMVRLSVKQPIPGAVSLTTAGGAVLWSRDPQGDNTQQQFDFALQVGDSVVLTGIEQPSTPTPAEPQAGTVLTFENDQYLLTAALDSGEAFPVGAVLTAEFAPAEWAAHEAALTALGLTAEQLHALVDVRAAITADGLPVSLADATLTCTLLRKGAADGAELAAILTDGLATPADGMLQTEEGALLTLRQAGLPAVTLAWYAAPAATPAPLAYTYENDAYRLSVTLPPDVSLPEGTALTAAIVPGAWDGFRAALQAAGYDQTRVTQLLTASATLTLAGEPVDVAGVPLSYALLLKGAACDGMLASLIRDAALTPATLTQTEEGALIRFDAADLPPFGLAVTLPGRTVFTYEDDALYAVATLSDAGAIPEGASLIVTPVPIDDTLKPYTDMIGQSTAQPEAPQADATAAPLMGYTFTAYDVRFVLDGQELEPASGTVAVSITNKADAALPTGDDVRVLHLSEAGDGLTPEELPATVTTEGGQSVLQFETGSFSIILVANGFTLQPPLTYDLIDQASETFVNSSFYNDNRVLGLAGNFHLVAFNTAYLNTHTNGNVLARKVYASSNFGTNNIPSEVSYIQNYAQVNSTSASSSAHTLVIGSVNTVGLTDGGSSFTINDTKIGKPNNLLQDANTATLGYVDFAAVASEVGGIQSLLASYGNGNLTKNWDDMNNRMLTMVTPGGLGVYNTTAAEMTSISSQPLKLMGLSSSGNGSIILNVDMSGATSVTMPHLYVYVDGTQVSTNETATFTSCRVLVNFINASGKTIDMKLANASVLAPGATVNLNQNLNGTVVADTIYVKAESHRDDYIGKLTDNVTVQKIWQNSDGTAMSPVPAGYEAVVQLYSRKNNNGHEAAYGAAVTLNSANGFKNTWSGLDKNAYTYFVKEVSVNGAAATTTTTSGTAGAFTISYQNNAGITGGVIRVTNQKQPTTSLSVTKSWKDTDGTTAYTGTKPAVTVQLRQGSTAYGAPVTLNSANGYTYTFADLPKYSSGTTPYTYSVEETVTPQGFTLVGVTYNAERTAATITNKRTATSITVQKVWNDGAAIHPPVTLQLTRGGTPVAGKTVTLDGTETPAWSYTFTGLPAGEYTTATTYTAYTYGVTETVTPTGYTKSESGLSVTNTPETVSVSVTKTWAGDAGYTAYRPNSLALTLKRKLADGTTDNTFSQTVNVTAAASWSTSVTGLPKGYYTKSGSTYTFNLYTYYITEPTTPTGYTKTESGLGVTNTFDTTKVRVTKVWQDDADGNGTYETPASTPAVTVQVLSGATVVDSYTFPANATTLTWESKALPKYTQAGALISYTVTEQSVAGYALTDTAYGTYAGGKTATLTNTYQRISIPVTKTWDLSGSSETPQRPQVTYKLYAVQSPGSGDTPIATIVVPAGSAASAYNTAFANLPKYDAGGTAIPYSVTEDVSRAYTVARTGSKDTGFAFTNTLDVTSLSGRKSWIGADGSTAYTGYRPAIRINLLRNGSIYAYRDFAATASGASADYSYTFQNLPRYAPNGDAYTYAVQEPTVAGFTATVSGANVQNRLLTTSVKITKNWNNNGYAGALTRPAVTVYLLNGVDKTTPANAAASHTFQSGASSYEHTFTNLPQGYFNASGAYLPYTYTVVEGPANGYTGGAVTGSAAAGFAVTNTLDTVSVSVRKTWALAQGVTTAPAIRIDLLRGGTVIDSKTITAGAPERSDYTFTWANLPKSDPATGVDYAYTVAEAILGGAAAGFEPAITYDTATPGVIAAGIVNTQKTVSLSGEKTWLDELGNTYAAALHRPALTVTLLQNGNPMSPSRSKTFAVDAADYTYAFTGLPQYDGSGNAYQYTVQESAVAGFTAAYPAVSGTTALTANVRNQLSKTSLTVQKTWLDNGTDVTAATSQSVTVQLLRKAEGETAFASVPGKTLTLTGASSPKYSGTFSDLPAGYVDAGGAYRAYTYSVAEQTLAGYTSSVGVTDTATPGSQHVGVTNTKGRMDYRVTKLWLAADSSPMAAPSGATVTVTLWQSIAGDAPTQVAGASVTLDGTADAATAAYESAPWVATFAGLAQYTEGGQPIAYSARESAATNAGGFLSAGQSVSATQYRITNTQTIVRVRKTSAIGGSALTGAGFTIQNVTEPTESYTLTGSAVLSDWVQYGLKPDTLYRITETVTPAGYLTADPLTFRISGSDGKVYVSTDGFAAAQADNRITIQNEPIDLKVVKLDVPLRTVTQAELTGTYAGHFVTGAALGLYAADGTTLLATITPSTADGTVYDLDYTKLVKGQTYYLKETVTPAGYKTAAPLAIVVGVDANGTIYVLHDDPIPYKTILVQKTWASGSIPQDVTFDLTLAGSSTVLETVVLPANDADGRIAFPGTAAICVGGQYPMTDQQGNPLTYVITERAVPGYLVTSAMAYTTTADALLGSITNAPTVADFSKKAITGSDELPGATLTLTDVTDTAPQLVETWVSGTAPHTVTGKLVPGHTYTFAETTAPAGYAVTESITFRVKADGTLEAVGTMPGNGTVQSGGVTMLDRQLTLTISKKALGGGEELPGASLTLTDTTLNREVAAWVGGSTAKTLASTVSAAGGGTLIDGLYYTFPQGQSYPLIAGHSYRLSEQAAPAGYLLSNAITFTIAADGSITGVSANGELAGTTLTLRDEINTLLLYKTDSQTGAKLPGAVFQLYEYSATAPDHLGARVFATQTIQTDASGAYTLYGLTNGMQYVLREVAAPAGYDLAPDTVFTYRDSQQSTPTVSVTVPNTRASLRLRKADPAGQPLAGATLAIWNQSKTQKLWEGVSIAAAPGNAEGWITLQAAAGQTDAAAYLVMGGQYYLHETAAPDGYRLNPDWIAFTFTQGGATSLTVTDAPLSLTISKVDLVGGAEIPGATLTLTDDTDAGRVVETWTTAVDGSGAVQPHTVDRALLKAGHTYTLTEVTAPDGYVHAESVRFTIAPDGSVTLVGTQGEVSGTQVTMTDARTSLTLQKRGMGDAPITAGVGFSLYQSNAAGDTLAQIGAEGLTFDRLLHGQYYRLVETTVPAGYVPMAPLTFRFLYDQATGATSLNYGTRADLSVSAAGGQATLTVTDAPTLVSVTKVDENGDTLPGAVLAVYTDVAGAPGALVPGTRFTTLTDDALTPADESVHTYAGLLTQGTAYWLVEESAPAGYALAAPLAFTAGASADPVTLTLTNKPLTLRLYKLDSDALSGGSPTGNPVTGVSLTLTGPYSLGGVTEPSHVWSWVTDGSPKVLTLLDGLVPGGAYTLHEDPATVPAGYQYAADMNFTLPLHGGDATYVMVDAPTGLVSVKVTKAFDQNAAGNPLTAAELPAGVTVRLWQELPGGAPATEIAQRTLTAPDNWTYTFTGLVRADGEGTAYRYFVTEDAVPGYTLRLTSADTDPSDHFAYTLTNTAGEVSLSKRDIAGDELPGAHMQLLDSTGNTIATWVSTTEPYVVRGKLLPGETYTLKETAAPDGYLVTSAFTFTLDSNLTPTVTGTTFGGVEDGVIYMVDAATTVTISKQAVGGSAELPGARLTLTHEGASGTVTDADFISGNAPRTIERLLVGTVYTLTETTAPNGYLVAESLQFIIQADGSVLAKRAGEPDSAWQAVTANTVILKDAPTTVTLSKRAVGGGAELPGAAVTVTHAEAGSTVTDAQWISGFDDAGTRTDAPRTLTGLTAGVVYTFTETTAPYGYTVAESIQFIIRPDGSVQARRAGEPDSAWQTVNAHTVIMTDAQTRVDFSKTDITGGAELPGAALTLEDLTPVTGQPQTVWQWISGSTPHRIQGELIAGHTYRLTEITAPAGYRMAESITFTIAADGSITPTNADGTAAANGSGTVDAATQTVTMKDAPTELLLRKVDDQTPPQPVAGAVLGIYTASGADASAPGTLVTTVTTGTDGTATVTGQLSLNAWYMIAELTTPTGYHTAEVSAPFQLGSDGAYTFTMVDKRTVFYVGKQDATTGEYISGATLIIYPGQSVGGQTVPDTSRVLATVQSIAGSPVAVYGLAENTTYFLYEAVAPDGYLRNIDLYTPFTIAPGGSTVALSVDVPTSVRLNKVDAGGTRLAGAGMALVRGNGVGYDPAADVVAAFTSSATADHTVTGLAVGQLYTLLETSAPDGYVPATQGVRFRINELGFVVGEADDIATPSTVTLVSIVNQPTEVIFSKRATGAGTAELPGATLTITHSENGQPVLDDQWITGNAPHTVRGKLLADGLTEYTFTEIGAPDGYTIAGSIVFRIQPDGSVQVRQPDGSFAGLADNTVIMTDAPIRLRVAKVDAVSGAPLAGAVFKVVADVAGAPAATAVTGFEAIVSGSAPVTVSGLPAGRYWLVETLAPVGSDASGAPVHYQLAAPVPFTLTDELLAEDALVSVTVADQPTTVTVLKLDSDDLDANGTPTGNRVPGATLTLTRRSEGAVLGTHTFDGALDWVLDQGQLEAGETYLLSETLAGTPAGYRTAGTLTFTVAQDGSDRWIVVDEPIGTRSVTVNKVWNDSLTTHPAVTVQLYRSDDPTTPYRTATLTAPGFTASFSGLPTTAQDGTHYAYTLAEAPVAGYLAGVFSAPVTSADGLSDTYTLTNTPTDIYLQKLAGDTGAPLPGASLTLVRGNGVGYTPADVVESWISGSDGADAGGTPNPHRLTAKLTVGAQYTLIETAAPAGYVRAANITFTVAPNGTLSVTGTNRLSMTDRPVTVRFAKLDNLTQAYVAGAGFSVYEDAAWQANAQTAQPVLTFTSQSTPVVSTGILTAGTLYRLVETSAPSGYQISGASIQFAAPTDDTVVSVHLKNPRIYRFAKVNSQSGAAVAGATLTVLDPQGNTVIAPWVSTNAPYEFVNSDASGNPILQRGVTYRLTELAAPTGYVLNTTPVTFTLDGQGMIGGGVTVTMQNTPDNPPEDDTIDLNLRKTWVDNSNAGNTRPAAGLTVFITRQAAGSTAEENVVTLTIPARAGNTWYLSLYDLPRRNSAGQEYTYRAREQVPAGYTATYTNNGFTMVNTYPTNEESPTPTPIPTLTPTPAVTTTRIPTAVRYVDGQYVYIDEDEVPLGLVPKTGDDSDYLLWGLAIALPLLLAFGAGVIALRRKRRAAHNAGR
ncbi:MAG: Cna B-type domain-containing protein [Candidatus Limiplasma sp.]|nr:Cna B-type domain-containing protein [Candidatus Limiplasma sp.]